MNLYEQYINNKISYEEYLEKTSIELQKIFDEKEPEKRKSKKEIQLEEFNLRFNESEVRTLKHIGNTNGDYLDCISITSLKKDTNEDFVGVSEKGNRKMLALADGVGSSEKSSDSSKYVIEELIKWFENSDIEFGELEEIITKKVEELGKSLDERQETTLVMAITENDKAFIYSVGDSRAYVIKDDCVEQVSEDQSVCWEKYKKGILKKDDIRFMSFNNIIYNAVSNTMDEPFTTYLDSYYNGILLTSDGVTDVLSDEKIFDTINNNKNEELNSLLRESFLSEPEEPSEELEYGEFWYSIINTRPGKDDTTAAILIKKR